MSLTKYTVKGNKVICHTVTLIRKSVVPNIKLNFKRNLKEKKEKKCKLQPFEKLNDMLIEKQKKPLSLYNI